MHEPDPTTPHAPRMLVAASGSAASRRATAIAAELACTFDAELTILHVIPATEYRTTRLGPILPINRRLDDPLTNDVLLDARRIAWTRGVSPKTVLIAGEAARAIEECRVDRTAASAHDEAGRPLRDRRRHWSGGSARLDDSGC